MCVPALLRVCAPVSYTHLDVYKRQLSKPVTLEVESDAAADFLAEIEQFKV